MSRPPTTAMVGTRAHAQRRLRRAANRRPFCSTNGCATFLVPDDAGRLASCPICGLRRPLASSAAPARPRTAGPDLQAVAS